MSRAFKSPKIKKNIDSPDICIVLTGVPIHMLDIRRGFGVVARHFVRNFLCKLDCRVSHSRCDPGPL